MGPNNNILATLQSCAVQLYPLNDPWWIIGSAAVVLHGVDPGTIRDIDILVSPNDAKTLSSSLQCKNMADQRSNRFRSVYLLKPDFGPFPVEIMAGLEFQSNGHWLALTPKTRQMFPIAGQKLYVPSRQELITILQLFGREKDLRRAEMLLK